MIRCAVSLSLIVSALPEILSVIEWRLPPQRTTSLDHLSISDAADFCRRTIRDAALEWAQTNLGTTDRLHTCIIVEMPDTGTRPWPSSFSQF